MHNTAPFYPHAHNSSIFHPGYSFLLHLIVRSLSLSSVLSLLITSFRISQRILFSFLLIPILPISPVSSDLSLPSLRHLYCPVTVPHRYRPFRYTIPYLPPTSCYAHTLLNFLVVFPFSLFAIHVPFPLSDRVPGVLTCPSYC